VSDSEQPQEEIVQIPADKVQLEGALSLPEGAKGIVIFAHGSGSSRHSPRNKMVAHALHHEKMGTLLFDLLTQEEDEIYETRFDIDLLTNRLLYATQFVQEQTKTKELAIGYFGASTGSASALKAAASLGEKIKAVVSRGGRPDLADEDLSLVQAPTLLIVGGDDPIVIDLNQKAAEQLKCENKLVVIEGATHLFEEPGKLEVVAANASEWFKSHL